MSEYREGLEQWLSGLNQEQQAALAEAIVDRGLVKSNGASKGGPLTKADVDEMVLGEAKKAVFVTRTATDDLLIKDAPPYKDVNGLHKIYDLLAYHENTLIKGPKGDGKTLSYVAWGAKDRAPLVMVECSEDTKTTNLHGSFFMRGKETGFVLGAIPTAIDVANEVGKCILGFEEVNALTPQIQKVLNAILDFRKSVSIPQIGRTYSLNPGAKLWVVATMNPSVYGGTYDLNEDLKSRMEEIEIDYPVPSQEREILKANCGNKVPDKMLDEIIRFAGQTRQKATQYALSSRDLVRLVNIISKFEGGTGKWDEALNIALQLNLCKFEGEDRAVVAKRAGSIWGNVTFRKCWGSSEVLS
jgi:MoxR-like ATPase